MSFDSMAEQFPEADLIQEGGEQQPFFMDDGMEPLPQTVEVETIEDIINQTGLSPDALDQYRVLHSAE